MTFLETITGSDLTREWTAFEARAGALPAGHRAAWEEVRGHLFRHSDLTGRNLTPLLDSALGLLDETAAGGRSVEEVLGGDVEGSCAAPAEAGGARSHRDRWRERVNRNVAGKLSRLGG
jgi:DNA-binding ferritin-like protein (Dps family)